MSIRLLQSIFIAGVLSPVDGSTLSLSSALEADLVNQGKAVWVAAPELTASELAHASAHARMRQPNGVPIILAQSAIPMILPSSGTMGANGALTGLTALPYSVFPQPCFMYFPADKVFSGSPAGMYYASITSATSATVYNNLYTSGLPQAAIPQTPTPVVDAGPGAYTQTTASDIMLASIVIPAGIMGLNGALTAYAGLTCINNANAKPNKLYFGGGSVLSANGALTNSIGAYQNAMISNRGSLGSQFLNAWGQANSGGLKTYAVIDTSIDQVLGHAYQLSVATDWIILEAFNVLIFTG